MTKNKTWVDVENCPLCESKEMKLFDSGKYRGGYELEYKICQKCGLVFMSPRPDQETLNQFYATEYRRLCYGDGKPPEAHLLQEAKRAGHFAEIASLNIPHQIENHIDIGSSTGRLMQVLQEKLNCQSLGIELSEDYRAFALSNGLTVYSSLDSFLNSDRSSTRFDLVTMSHVLEHFEDPVDSLKLIRKKIVKPDGYILIEVPNLYGHICFDVSHNFAFSQATLKETLRKSGFSPIFVKLHGFPRHEKPWYISILAKALPLTEQDSYKVKSKPNWVKFQRKRALSKYWYDKKTSRQMFLHDLQESASYPKNILRKIKRKMFNNSNNN